MEIVPTLLIFLTQLMRRSRRLLNSQEKIRSIRGLSCAEGAKFMHTGTKMTTLIFTRFNQRHGLRSH